MCILHYFWFVLFNNMLYKFIVKGQAEDVQNKVEEKPKTTAGKPASPTKKRGSAEKLE